MFFFKRKRRATYNHTMLSMLWNKLGFHPSHILGGMPTDEILKEHGGDREQALATIGSGLGA